MTTSSIWLAPLDVSQVHWLTWYAETMKSASMPGQVGADGMNAKDRG